MLPAEDRSRQRSAFWARYPDHLFEHRHVFPRGDNKDAAPRTVACHLGIGPTGGIGCTIQLQPGTDGLADLAGVLTNAGGEDQPVAAP
jgi:hypothetical protein